MRADLQRQCDEALSNLRLLEMEKIKAERERDAALEKV